MSQFRATQVYVSIGMKQQLRLLAKAEGIESADEMAEKLLTDVINEKYPALVVHQKRIEELELAVIEGMKEKISG